MATIQTSQGERIYSIKNWGGLHESPDGDTKLSLGEAAEMRNFRITSDKNLQIRPGYRVLTNAIFDTPIYGLWSGTVSGKKVTVAVADSKLWLLDFNSDYSAVTKNELGDMLNLETSFFSFSDKLYMLNGTQFCVWDGDCTVMEVVGYRPLVSVSAEPSGGGTLLQRVNLLNGMRRCRFSPDGTSDTFHLPETNLKSIDFVLKLDTDEVIPETDYDIDLEAGTVKFSTPPEKGINTLEIGWTFPTNFRYKIDAMRFAEIYNGSTDNRVFLYGDGSNQLLYSDLDYDGLPTAEYFPDLNSISVGTANTPVTGAIRHFSRLLVFKSDSTYSVSYSTITLDDGSVTAAFSLFSVNKSIGNEAMGQVCLVLNNPLTLFNKAVYMWQNTSSYSANLTIDERQAKMLSQRVFSTLSTFDFSKTKVFDDNLRQEQFIIYGDTAVINSYGTDTWFIYTKFPFSHMIFVGNEIFGAINSISAGKGAVYRISRDYGSDTFPDEQSNYETLKSEPIDALWRSGSISFDAEWERKYSAKLFVAMKPEGNAQINVTLRTDKKSNFAEKLVNYRLATFERVDFTNWSFMTNYQPQIERLKLKAKKFAFYQLLFSSEKINSTATILSADIAVRYMGYVK